MSKSSLRAFGCTLFLIAGCGGAAIAPAPAALPPLSALDKVDVAQPVAPAVCSGGWMVEESPHRGNGQSVQFASDSKGVLHAVYANGYLDESDNKGYLGWRHLSATDPTHPDSIAWGPQAAFAIGSDDVPTLFVQTGSDTQPSVTRTRLVNGSWQSDAEPLWRGAAGDKIGTLRASFAGKSAHVLIVTYAEAIIARDDGGWKIDKPSVLSGGATIASSFTDEAGHDWVAFQNIGTFAYLIGTNASGSWKTTDPMGTLFTEDADGHVIAFGGGGDGIYQQTFNSDGTVAGSLAIKSDHAGALLDAKLDPQGRVEALIDDNGVLPEQAHGPFDVTDAGGKPVTSTLPIPMVYVATGKLAFDAQGQPHYALTYMPGPDIVNIVRIGFAHRCQ